MNDQQIAEAVKGFSDAQVEKALALIADGGMVETGFAREWIAVSSDGSKHYLCAPDACGCRAGRNERRCYHRAAAALLDAHRKAA